MEHHPHISAAELQKRDREMDYEEKALPSKQITVWIGGLLLTLLGIMGLMWALFGTPHSIPRQDVVTTRKMLQPTLQADPAKNMKKFKHAQMEQLESFGWVDKGAGVVRIPVDLAMELSLQRGMFRGGK